MPTTLIVRATQTNVSYTNAACIYQVKCRLLAGQRLEVIDEIQIEKVDHDADTTMKVVSRRFKGTAPKIDDQTGTQ